MYSLNPERYTHTGFPNKVCQDMIECERYFICLCEIYNNFCFHRIFFPRQRVNFCASPKIRHAHHWPIEFHCYLRQSIIKSSDGQTTHV